MCFVALFFLQNVFNQQVYRDASYVLSQTVLDRLQVDGIEVTALARLKNKRFDTVTGFRKTLREEMDLSEKVESKVLSRARITPTLIDNSKLWRLDNSSLTKGQVSSMWQLVGRKFDHLWMLDEALAEASEEWRSRPATKINKLFNRHVQGQRREVYQVFHIEPPQPE